MYFCQPECIDTLQRQRLISPEITDTNVKTVSGRFVTSIHEMEVICSPVCRVCHQISVFIMFTTINTRCHSPSVMNIFCRISFLANYLRHKVSKEHRTLAAHDDTHQNTCAYCFLCKPTHWQSALSYRVSVPETLQRGCKFILDFWLHYVHP